MKGILQTQDEKNHVLYTTTDSLDKQLKRCESSYQYIEDEVSEEARLGSMTHWAYSTEKAIEKKSMMGSERTRRANHLAAENDAAAGRSDARRETAAARKGRGQYIDSDFDDPRAHGKRAHNGGKSRKGEAVYGLGITNTGPANKRRKVEQLAMGGVAMGRSISSAYGSNARGASPAVDNKKKSRATTVATNGRKRYADEPKNAFLFNLTQASRGGTLDSPNIASSPILGTFTTGGSKAQRTAGSPAPSSMQRIPSSRGKQASAQANTPTLPTAASLPRNRSISTANGRAPNGGGIDHDRPTSLPNNNKPGSSNQVKDPPLNDVNGALLERSRDNSSSTNSRTRGDRPPSISVRGGGTGRNGSTSHATSNSRNASKNATPLVASFDNPPTRPKRDPPVNKRSHKKGAAAAARMEWEAHNGDEEGEGEEGEDEEEVMDTRRYCYCNEVSHGQMVACDSDDCEREWFHLHCIGLTRPPKAEGESKLSQTYGYGQLILRQIIGTVMSARRREGRLWLQRHGARHEDCVRGDVLRDGESQSSRVCMHEKAVWETLYFSGNSFAAVWLGTNIMGAACI